MLLSTGKTCLSSGIKREKKVLLRVAIQGFNLKPLTKIHILKYVLAKHKTKDNTDGLTTRKMINRIPVTNCKIIELDISTDKCTEFIGVRYRNKLDTDKIVIWVWLQLLRMILISNFRKGYSVLQLSDHWMDSKMLITKKLSLWNHLGGQSIH